MKSFVFVSMFISVSSLAAPNKKITVWIEPSACSDNMRILEFGQKLESDLAGKARLQVRMNPAPPFEAPNGSRGDRNFLFSVGFKCAQSQNNSRSSIFIHSIHQYCGSGDDLKKIQSCMSSKAKDLGLDAARFDTCVSPAIPLAKLGKAPDKWNSMTPEIRSVLEDFQNSARQGGRTCRFVVVDGKVYDFSVSTIEPHPTLEQEFAETRKAILQEAE